MRNARALLLGLAVLLVLLVTFLIHHLTREPHVTRPPVPSDLVDAATGAWAWTRDVDFVYTWVNGSDEAYRDVRRAIGGPEAVGSSRDRESNELVHSLRSVELWAPWWKGRLFIVYERIVVFNIWLALNRPGLQGPAWSVSGVDQLIRPAHSYHRSRNALPAQG